MQTFSFIAGEGASQLARLSGTGHSSSFSGSASDSQHKPLHSRMALRVAACVFGGVCVSEGGCVCMWELSVIPSSRPRIQMNSRKLQRQPQLIDMHYKRTCALPHVCAECARARSHVFSGRSVLIQSD